MNGSKARGSPVFGAAAISAAAAFLLCGYEFVRSTSNTLFKEAYGKEGLPVVMALSPLGVVAVLYVYGRLLSWLGPRKTLLLTTLGSGAAIGACYLAIQGGSRPATGVLYVLREAYIVLLIEQYWSFLNSTLGTEAAKKLNGPICGVASLGAVLGGTLVYQLSARCGTAAMLVFGAGACVPAAVVSEIAYRGCGEPERGAAVEERAGHLGVRLFGSQPMLIFLLLAVVATQVVSTTLDLAFQGMLQQEIPERDAQNAYSGLFFAVLNGGAAVSQFVLAPLFLRFMPLGLVHALIPLANITACVCAALEPNLRTAGVAYLLFKVLDYSLFRAAKEVLYIPFSFDVRYRAKEVIDVLGYRCGKGGTSLAITLAQRAGVFLSAGLHAAIGVTAAALWAGAILLAVRAFNRARASEAADVEKHVN